MITCPLKRWYVVRFAEWVIGYDGPGVRERRQRIKACSGAEVASRYSGRQYVVVVEATGERGT
jgi:hypothetical protein